MFSLLIPLIALSASVQATVFKRPVQVNFIVEDPLHAGEYGWVETTDSWSGEPNTPTEEGYINDVGSLMIRGTDDGRTFNWSNPNIDEGKEHMVS
jgi:hypothetical protein